MINRLREELKSWENESWLALSEKLYEAYYFAKGQARALARVIDMLVHLENESEEA